MKTLYEQNLRAMNNPVLLVPNATGPAAEKVYMTFAPTEILISTTATQTGFGCDGHKTVVGLSDEERAHIRAGGTVLYDCGRLSRGLHGTTWRSAVAGQNRKFYPRVPTAADLEAAGVE